MVIPPLMVLHGEGPSQFLSQDKVTSTSRTQPKQRPSAFPQGKKIVNIFTIGMFAFCIFAPQKENKNDIHPYEIPTANRCNRPNL